MNSFEKEASGNKYQLALSCNFLLQTILLLSNVFGKNRSG